MKKRNKFSFFGDRRFKNLRRGDSLKIGNLKSNLKVKNRRYLSSLRFLKHRELFYCYNLRWISRIPQDLPSKSNFQDLQRNQKIPIEILQRNSNTIAHRIRAQFLQEFFSMNRATNDCFYYPLASAKFSLALCRGNALSGIRTALHRIRDAFPCGKYCMPRAKM